MTKTAIYKPNTWLNQPIFRALLSFNRQTSQPTRRQRNLKCAGIVPVPSQKKRCKAEQLETHWDDKPLEKRPSLTERFSFRQSFDLWGFLASRPRLDLLFPVVSIKRKSH
jgi:hypothetical protein